MLLALPNLLTKPELQKHLESHQSQRSRGPTPLCLLNISACFLCWGRILLQERLSEVALTPKDLGKKHSKDRKEPSKRKGTRDERKAVALLLVATQTKTRREDD